MLIARVLGEVVATQKHASHVGRKILMVQPVNLDGSDRGDAVLALDAVDAGVGDRVLLTMEGYSAMTSVGRPESPIDMAVVGVIDRIDLFGDVSGTGRGPVPIDIAGSARPAAPADLPVRDRRRRRAD
jgi:ethanolamine utilization protein EutN